MSLNRNRKTKIYATLVSADENNQLIEHLNKAVANGEAHYRKVWSDPQSQIEIHRKKHSPFIKEN